MLDRSLIEMFTEIRKQFFDIDTLFIALGVFVFLWLFVVFIDILVDVMSRKEDKLK